MNLVYAFRCFFYLQQRPDRIYFNGHNQDSIADSISSQLRMYDYTFGSETTQLGALGHLCGFTMIPYGEAGHRYVEEKIKPLALEDFLWEKSQDLLGALRLSQNETVEEFYNLAHTYCRQYCQPQLPWSLMGVAVLATRYFSERTLKSFRNIPQQETYDYVEYACDYFMELRKNPPAVLDIPYHVEQLCRPQPGEALVFSDAQRGQIDSLPIFTGFARKRQ